MKPTLKIQGELIDNSNLFQNDFYHRFDLNEFSLKLNNEISKEYLFPTFYGNVTQSVGIFLCSYEKAKNLMPHKNLLPVKMGFGRTLVIFSCYEYINVHQVASYNEIAMTIPVMANPFINIPLLPMVLSSMFKKFGYYVFSMPVTSLENQIRGHKIWGLPKTVQEISCINEDGYHISSAKEDTGEEYFKLKVPVTGVKSELDEKGYLYSKLNNKMIRAETCFKGQYNINKYMKRLISYDKTENSYLTLGDTPNGRILKDLEIDSQPFQFRYAENVSSCFDLPDRESENFLSKNFNNIKE